MDGVKGSPMRRRTRSSKSPRRASQERKRKSEERTSDSLDSPAPSSSAAFTFLVLSIVCPTIFASGYLAAESAPGVVGSFLPVVDSSQDLSQDRFHTVFATPLELHMHAAMILCGLTLPMLLIPIYGSMAHLSPGLAIRRGAAGSIAGAACWHLLAVLFGAPVLDAWPKTAAFGLYMSALTAAPMACVLGGDAGGWVAVLAAGRTETPAEAASYAPAVGAAVGAWLGALPIPLDWDRPWQAWPITCVLGAAAGHALGLAAAAAAAAFPRRAAGGSAAGEEGERDA